MSLPSFLENGIDSYLRKSNYVIVDLETTTRQKGSFTDPLNSLVLACWTTVKPGTRKLTSRFSFSNEYLQQPLLEDISRADFIVAHNAIFELGWLERCGLDLRQVLVYDTMVGEWVIQGNRKAPLSLDETAKRYGLGGKEAFVSTMIKTGACPSEIPMSWLQRYCEKDVSLCHQIFLKQHEIITQGKLWPIVLSRNLVLPCLADMQSTALELDANAVEDEALVLTETIAKTGTMLDKMAPGVNFGSRKQLATLLYDDLGFNPPIDPRTRKPITTAKGALSTAVATLSRLKPTTKKQTNFLEAYKAYNKATSLWQKSMLFFTKVVQYRGGTFFGEIRPGQTGTHRLASAGIPTTFPGLKKPLKCQIQNLPREYKKLFTAHHYHYVVMEADGAGMEFRVAAMLGHDTQARDDIVGGEDIHGFTMNTINAAYEQAGSKKRITRQEAKSRTFTPLFLGRGQDKAEQTYARAFNEKYHGIYSTQRDWIATVASTKQLQTPYGMRYYWPHAKVESSGWVTHSNEIANAPIQGLATAEIIPVALVHLWHRLADLPVEIFNTVHDSIVMRVDVRYLEHARERTKLAMTTDVYEFFKKVYGYELWPDLPLGVGFKVGKHWGEADQEEIYDIWQNGRERLTVKTKDETKVVYDRAPTLTNSEPTKEDRNHDAGYSTSYYTQGNFSRHDVRLHD